MPSTATTTDERSAKTPMSEWLQNAIRDTALRDPLLAAEDAIMLVDIVIAVEKGTLSFEMIRSDPLTGDWLKHAVADNLKRPAIESHQDTALFLDIVLMNLLAYYNNGHIHHSDDLIRLSNIFDMVLNGGKGAVARWAHAAARHIKAIAEAQDGGIDALLTYVSLAHERGHHELGEIFDQMSALTEGDLRKRLTVMSDALMALKTHIQ